MIDFSKSDYFCDGQMNFEECLAEIERYKWESGQYMNLPEETEEKNNEHHRIHSEGL